jgi:NAD(P)-dependent dehydrogenase (short-subunit alcohol dehydrogenase family)
MTNDFADQVALVTGAASGIGRQLSLFLARDGARVAAIDTQQEGLEKLATEVAGGRLAWAAGDVTNRESLGNAVAQVVRQLGSVDLVIANAGIGFENSALSFRAEDFEAHIRVNLIGVANTIEAVLSGMIERRKGHLVAISSLASYRGTPKMLGYCASKSGVNALMEGLRAELIDYSIAVTTICPGWIRTPLTAQVELEPSMIMELPEAAERILGAIRERRPFYAFPPWLVRRVRLLKWLPAKWSDWLTLKSVPKVTNAQVPLPPK